jgi:hypothetical protein
MTIPPDSRCARALQATADFARQIVDGSITPYDGATRIASELGACYDFLNEDLEPVDLLAALAGYADLYQELQLDPMKAQEIDKDVIEAATKFVRSNLDH